MKKKCKVVSVPNSKGIVHRNKEYKEQIQVSNHFGNEKWTNEHLYLVSDDEIKVGDYAYCGEIGKPFKVDEEYFRIGYEADGKVIATTDEQLGLPIIPERFVKEYCEKGGVDEVMCEVSDDAFEIYPVKESWTREEVEQLCRTAYKDGIAMAESSNFTGKYIDFDKSVNEWIYYTL